MRRERVALLRTALFQKPCRRSFGSSSGVKIVEVGPRDGLQNEAMFVPTSDKIELIRKLADAGCTSIEATSFVSPKWVPAMSDSRQVMMGLENLRHRLSCLVPNRRGLDLAMGLGAKEIAVFGSASETFSQKNINCSVDESLERFRQVIQPAKDAQIRVRGYVSCVLGCPYEGDVDPSQVVAVAEKLIAMGCHEVSLGDTIGVGTPSTTRNMLDVVQSSIDTEQLAVHFHDTFGQAIANICVALERDVSTIDSSVSGLGGCPYAAGASGNVASEEVVYLLDGLGVETGINLDKLVDAGEFICDVLQRPTRSKVAAAILAKRRQ